MNLINIQIISRAQTVILLYSATSYEATHIGTVESQFNKVLRDLGNWFIILRVCYIEVLWCTFYCNFSRAES